MLDPKNRRASRLTKGADKSKFYLLDSQL